MDYHPGPDNNTLTFDSALPSHDCDALNDPPDTGFQPPPGAVPAYKPHMAGLTNSPPGKPRQLSEKEWEDLKGVLHMYYIQENKTLDNTQKIMRDKHSIFLSQKQLTTRFAKWKFKKNSKKSQTGSFLQTTESALGQAQYSVDGVRITAAKRERWKRTAGGQLRKGLQPSYPGDSGGSFAPFSAHQYKRECADAMAVDSPDMSSSQAVPTLSPNNTSPMARHENLDMRSSPSTLSPDTISPMTLSLTVSPRRVGAVASDEPAIGQDDASRQLISDCSCPLSPISGDSEPLLLHRLFSALSLTPPNDITPFCLSAVATETAIKDAETISNKELIHLSHGGGDASWQSTDIIVHSTQRHSPRKQTAESGFKYSGMDVIFPSQVVVFTSAFSGELYPFPSPDKNRAEARSMSKYHDILRSEMQECKDKISKFEISFSGNNAALATAIDRLAVAYFGLGHYDEAERQFNRVLPILVQRHGPNSRYVVSVKRDLAEVILHLGRFAEANQLAREVHKSALGLDVPGGHLIQKSLQVLAQSYGNLGNLGKEEELLRELVQIRLVTSGPRHGDTLAAIRSLCDSVIDSERYAESEELLRVALELSQGAQGLSDRRKCLIFRKLATVLYKQRNYLESEMLYRKTAEMSERLLGNEHPDTLRCRFWLCKVLRARGSLEESCRILQETVKTQISTRGELRGSTIESMAGLSTLLVQMERMKEAQMWMMRALHCSQKIGGVESKRTMRFCDNLERLNAEQEQKNAVVDLYEEMCREICTLVGPGSRSIEEMSACGDRNRR